MLRAVWAGSLLPSPAAPGLPLLQLVHGHAVLATQLPMRQTNYVIIIIIIIVIIVTMTMIIINVMIVNLLSLSVSVLCVYCYYYH